MKGAHRREAVVVGGGFETGGVGGSSGCSWTPAISTAPGAEGGVRYGGKRAWEAGGVGAHREGSWQWWRLWFQCGGGPPAVALRQEAKGGSGEALRSSQGRESVGEKSGKGTSGGTFMAGRRENGVGGGSGSGHFE
jgi:hypothetical protein